MNGENANVARLFTAICHASKNLKALTSSSSFIFLYEYSVMIHDSPHYSDSRNVLTQHLIDLIRRGSTNESKTCTAIRHWAPLAGDGCRSALAARARPHRPTWNQSIPGGEGVCRRRCAGDPPRSCARAPRASRRPARVSRETRASRDGVSRRERLVGTPDPARQTSGNSGNTRAPLYSNRTRTP